MKIPSLSELEKELEQYSDLIRDHDIRISLISQISIMRKVEPLLEEREEMLEFVKKVSHQEGNYDIFPINRLTELQVEAKLLLAKLGGK
jgi:hypothetical protein